MKCSLSLSACVLLCLMAGKSSAQTTSTAKLTLKGAGASHAYPLYSKWFDAYKAKIGVDIQYQAIGSGGGFQQFKNNAVDFASVEVPLIAEEKAEIRGGVVEVPTAGRMLGITYNLPGWKGQLRLDGPTLAAIYLGDIKSWNDRRVQRLNPSKLLPAAHITVTFRNDNSSLNYLFTRYLSAVSPKWKSKVGFGKGVDWPTGIGSKGSVAPDVKQTRGGIGYIDAAYAWHNKVPLAAIKNAAGRVITPTLKSGTATLRHHAIQLAKNPDASIVNSPGREAYPIMGMCSLLIRRRDPSSAKHQELRRFLRWALTEGQAFNEPAGYPALPVEVQEQGLKQLQQPPAPQVTLKGSGTSNIYPLFRQWIKDYKAKTKGQIDYEAIGSGGGLNRLMNGDVDFACVGVYLNRRERSRMEFPVLQVPNAGLMVAIVYNLPEAKKPLRLDGPTLADMYLGKITYWNDKRLQRLNPSLKLPKRWITRFGQWDGIGDSQLLACFLAETSPEWRQRMGNGYWPDVPSGLRFSASRWENVKSMPYSITYMPAQNAAEEKFRVASIRNAAGRFVLPTLTGGRAAMQHSLSRFQIHDLKPPVNAPGVHSYPITGVTSFVIRKHGRESQRHAEVHRFVRWTMSDGQRWNEQSGFPAIPANVRRSLLKQLN